MRGKRREGGSKGEERVGRGSGAEEKGWKRGEREKEAVKVREREGRREDSGG